MNTAERMRGHRDARKGLPRDESNTHKDYVLGYKLQAEQMEAVQWLEDNKKRITELGKLI